jgi:hypothetical protein
MISLLKSTFSRTDTRVLVVATERAILYLFDGGEMTQAYIFGADEAGLAAFGRCMTEIEIALLCVLVDVVEEEYRQDTMPHVSGADRKSVLARKYTRLFRGTPYHHALHQGRESGERKDDRVLLTAITRPEVLTPWLQVLTRHKIPLAGIYSLPILSGRLLKRIGATAPNVLLITLQKASGLRQTFFREGHLKISRLAHVPRLGSVPFAAHLMSEVEKLRRYLNSLALISRDSPLSIYILSHGQMLGELEQYCRNSAQEKFYLLDIDDVGRRIGLKQAGNSHYADLVFAKLMTGKAIANHYAQPQERQFHAMYRLRSALAMAGGILLLASAGWSGFNLIEGVILKGQALEAAQKSVFYEQRFEMARRKLPATPVAPREIKTAVDAVQILRGRKSSPESLMRLLGDALISIPDIQLDQLNWHTSAEAHAAGDRRPRGAQTSAVPEGDYAYYQITELSGHLTPFSGDYRAAIAVIDRLAAALKVGTDVASVEVVQYPLDVRSDASVSGSATAAHERVVASFKLKLVVGMGDGEQDS